MITFNNTDLSDYGLVITENKAYLFEQEINYVQMPDMAYGFDATAKPKSLEVRVSILGTDYTDVRSKIDSIKAVLNMQKTGRLIFNVQPDRYYNAYFRSLTGIYEKGAFSGLLEFTCPDLLAYSITETSHNHTIDASPKTVTETTGGTAYIKPVYTLTAGADLESVTIKVENINADEELQWTGSLDTNDILEIDVANWIVEKNGSASMGTVVGQFPRLLPSFDNQIKVTAFTGTLNIKYRNTWV